jgi:hypothetical protein
MATTSKSGLNVVVAESLKLDRLGRSLRHLVDIIDWAG